MTLDEIKQLKKDKWVNLTAYFRDNDTPREKMALILADCGYGPASIQTLMSTMNQAKKYPIVSELLDRKLAGDKTITMKMLKSAVIRELPPLGYNKKGIDEEFECLMVWLKGVTYQFVHRHYVRTGEEYAELAKKAFSEIQRKM